jgi:hypothetical protein
MPGAAANPIISSAVGSHGGQTNSGTTCEGKLLADMHGKKPSDVVRLVKNADVKFNVKDGRMYHEGLRFGFPDISPDLIVKSSGSVGLDTALDVVLEVPGLLVEKNELDIKKAPPVRYRIAGTIDKPIVTEIKDGKER